MRLQTKPFSGLVPSEEGMKMQGRGEMQIPNSHETLDACATQVTEVCPIAVRGQCTRYKWGKGRAKVRQAKRRWLKEGKAYPEIQKFEGGVVVGNP